MFYECDVLVCVLPATVHDNKIMLDQFLCEHEYYSALKEAAYLEFA